MCIVKLGDAVIRRARHRKDMQLAHPWNGRRKLTLSRRTGQAMLGSLPCAAWFGRVKSRGVRASQRSRFADALSGLAGVNGNETELNRFRRR